MLFDEESGAKLTEQVDFAKPETQKLPSVKVPWRDWRDWRCVCGPSGQDEADKATAVAVLDAIDENFPVEKQPIEVYCDDNKLYRVTAVGNVPLRTIWLPPCIPKQSKVHAVRIATSHPHSVQIKETMKPGTTDGSGVPVRECTFSVLPEWKMPENKNGNAAVAEWKLSLIHI